MRRAPSRRPARTGKPRGDDGNIIVALMVMTVTTTLIIALVSTTLSGLRTSRRASGSANALQAADAGINDAAKAIDAQSCAGSGCSFTASTTIGPGSYSYTATWTATNTWQVVSIGTDTATHTQRKIIADATAAPLFGNAFFAVAGATLKGTADSYTGPTDTCDSGANAAGNIGSDGGISLTQSAGSSSYNCQQYINGYQYAADGCVFYGQSSVPSGYVGPGMCPPAPGSTATIQPFQPPAVTAPSSSEGDFTCSTSGGIPTDRTHVYTNITLSGGCSVPSGKTAILYAVGNVTIGTSTGNCNSFVNAPPGATCQSSGANSVPVWPTNYYTTGWPAGLLIKVAGSGTVSFANHAEFWGIIDAPDGTVSATGSGTPQVNVFGAVVAHSAGAAAQFQFHYDESLEQIASTGEYQVKDWREVPLGATY